MSEFKPGDVVAVKATVSDFLGLEPQAVLLRIEVMHWGSAGDEGRLAVTPSLVAPWPDDREQ